MKISSRSIEDVSTIELIGEVDSVSKRDLENLLQEFLDTGCHQVVVDLEQVEFMSSTGMSVFLEYLVKFRDIGGDLRISCVQRDVIRVFRFTKLVEVFKIFETTEDAVRSFSPWAITE
jgi:anti-anti-sigma factor